MTLLSAAALGLLLGALTGMPLGVVNVAIVDAAIAQRRSFALGIAFGGAVADATHALLAFLGIGRVVASHPAWTRILAAVAAVIIIGYAVVAWRRGSAPSSERSEDLHDGAGGDGADTISRGTATGLALTLPNPGALAAWAAVAASLWPAASVAESIVFAAGVGIGSAAWFVLLGRLVARVRRDHPALAYVPKIALALFVALAVVGVMRAFA